jgi:UDP-3-O-[3-hydroxymyristoyl] glucosamine N-acyltransferase
VPLSLGDLAAQIGATCDGDLSLIINRISTLELAGPGDVSFFSNRRYKSQLGNTAAAAVILAAKDADLCAVSTLVVDNPYLGYMRAATVLSPPVVHNSGVHRSALVDDTASVHATAWIGPNVVIEANVLIGANTHIGPNCIVGRASRVGENCRLVANVTLCHAVAIGDRACIHPGVVIGADGFGIANDGGVWHKVPQLGAVRIGNDVEVGANTSIDRGALDDTVIANGVKLDNQVQVAHNVHIGEHTAIAGCVGIAGSTHIGARCTIGGAVAIGGHLEIVDDVHVTGASVVASSIKEAGLYSSGMMVQDNRSWRRTHARIRQLDDMWKKLRGLEDRTRDL